MQRCSWRMVVIVLALAGLAGVARADFAIDFRTNLDGVIIAGQYDDGINQCGVFIAANPGNVQGYVERARCYMKLNEWDLALADLNLARPLGDNLEVLGLIGECQQELGQDDDATATFIQCQGGCRAALLVSATDADACFWMGRSYYDLDDYDLGIEWCQRGIYCRPQFYSCSLFLGDLYFQIGDVGLSVGCFNNCIGWYPNACEAYGWRARCYVDRGNYRAADADLNHCDQLNPHFARTEYIRGVEAQKQGHWDQAQTHYARATDLNPHDSRAYLARGEAEQKLGRGDAANQDLQKAQDLDKGNYDARQGRRANVEAAVKGGHGQAGRQAGGQGGQGGAQATAQVTREHPPASPGVRAHAPVSHAAAQKVAERSEDRPRGSVAHEAQSHVSGGGGGASHTGGGDHH